MPSTWLSGVLLPLLALGMEAAWLAPLLVLAVGGATATAGAGVTPGAVAGLLAAVALGLRALLVSRAPQTAVRAAAVATAALSTLVVVWAAYFAALPLLSLDWLAELLMVAGQGFGQRPGVLFTVLACAVVWWRGARLATAEVGWDDVLGRFRTGIGWLVLMGVVRLIGGQATFVQAATGGLGGLTLAFFGCGLLGLSLSRLLEVAPGREEGRLGANRPWLGVLLAAVAAEVVVALLFTALLSPDVLSVVMTPVGWVAWAVSRLLLAVVYAVAFAVELLLYGIKWLLITLGVSVTMEPLTPPQFDQPDEWQTNADDGALPAAVVTGLRLGGTGALATVALLLLARGLLQRRGAAAANATDERESLWSWQVVQEDLAGGLAGLLRRLRGQGAAALAHLPLGQADRSTVRAVYRALLATAAARGYRRAPATRRETCWPAGVPRTPSPPTRPMPSPQPTSGCATASPPTASPLPVSRPPP